MKKQSALTRLFEYAGNYKYFTMLSRILSVISTWIALVPFYYIWRIMKEVLDVAPAYDQAKRNYIARLECRWLCIAVHDHLYCGIDVFAYCSVPYSGQICVPP